MNISNTSIESKLFQFF